MEEKTVVISSISHPTGPWILQYQEMYDNSLYSLETIYSKYSMYKEGSVRGPIHTMVVLNLGVHEMVSVQFIRYLHTWVERYKYTILLS